MLHVPYVIKYLPGTTTRHSLERPLKTGETVYKHREPPPARDIPGEWQQDYSALEINNPVVVTNMAGHRHTCRVARPGYLGHTAYVNN